MIRERLWLKAQILAWWATASSWEYSAPSTQPTKMKWWKDKDFNRCTYFLCLIRFATCLSCEMVSALVFLRWRSVAQIQPVPQLPSCINGYPAAFRDEKEKMISHDAWPHHPIRCCHVKETIDTNTISLRCLYGILLYDLPYIYLQYHHANKVLGAERRIHYYQSRNHNICWYACPIPQKSHIWE